MWRGKVKLGGAWFDRTRQVWRGLARFGKARWVMTWQAGMDGLGPVRPGAARRSQFRQAWSGVLYGEAGKARFGKAGHNEVRYGRTWLVNTAAVNDRRESKW